TVSVRTITPSVHYRHLRSFPTRRSSDLAIAKIVNAKNVTVAIANAASAKIVNAVNAKNAAGKTVVKTSSSAKNAAMIASAVEFLDRKSTRLNSSHVKSSYAVFCLKKKKS